MTTSGTGPINPANQIANTGTIYVNGARLTYVGTTSFTIGSGLVRDSTNKVDMLIGGNLYSSATDVAGEAGEVDFPGGSVAVTVSIAALGAGGLDVGTVAASTFYYVYVIGDSRGFNNGAGLLSLSRTAPQLPLGYDSFRRVGGISTDGSSHVRAFTQTGVQALKTMRYQIPVAPGTASTAGSVSYTTVGTLTTLVPQLPIPVDVIFSAALTPNAAGNVLYMAPFGNVAIASNGFQAVLSAEVTGHAQQGVLVVPGMLNAAGTPILEVDYATTSGSDVVAFLVMGYVDPL